MMWGMSTRYGSYRRIGLSTMKRGSMEVHGLDRSSLHRSDQSWINKTFNDERARIIPVHDMTVLCDNSQECNTLYLTHKDLPESLVSADSSIFLGMYDGIPYFAADVGSHDVASMICRQTNTVFRDLRSMISLLHSRDWELLSLACFMTYWHARNRYCGKCGHETKSSEAGHVRICQNEACGENHFPSMDPAIIVLVSHGERCLLGRSKGFRKGIYSTLAGFVEPGEAIEDAVAREIKEEVGIDIDTIEYQQSQPWLFPKSLMLGFTASAKEEKIIIDENELEDARWFTREEVRSNPHILPSSASIAYKLIMGWLSKEES